MTTIVEKMEVAADEMTAADYYFDSYAHFGEFFFLLLFDKKKPFKVSTRKC